MKKTIQTMLCLLLALAMVFALTACGSSGTSGAAQTSAGAGSAQTEEGTSSQSTPQTDASAQSTLSGSDVEIGSSTLYTQEELTEAAEQIRSSFADWEGCELHSLRYAGDECSSEENLQWLNSLNEGANYTQVAEFLMNFHSPVDENAPSAWEPDQEYEDYQWWLARSEDGGWEIVSTGY